MKDHEIAELFAGQTAVTYVILEKLIEAGVVERRGLTLALYDLIETYMEEGQTGRQIAPIRHLINLVEHADDD